MLGGLERGGGRSRLGGGADGGGGGSDGRVHGGARSPARELHGVRLLRERRYGLKARESEPRGWWRLLLKAARAGHFIETYETE